MVYAAIQDQFNDFGDNLFYEALFTSVKPPVDYNATEEELHESGSSNDGLSLAQEVESGEKVMVVDGEVEAILEMGDIEFVKMHTTEGFDL